MFSIPRVLYPVKEWGTGGGVHDLAPGQLATQVFWSLAQLLAALDVSVSVVYHSLAIG